MTLGPDVRAVTYDLWLTLLVDDDPDRTHDLRAAAVADVLGLAREEAVGLLRTAYGALHASWRAGRALTVPQIAGLVLQGAGRDLDLAPELEDALESPTSQAGVRLVDGAREVLTALTGRGLPLALVCDTGMSSGRHLRHLLDDLGVLDAFAVTVFSDETGVPKPGNVPFARALEGVRVAPEHAVHVGDIRRRDVAGARAAGMVPVRSRGARDDPDDVSPDAPHVLDAHAELLPLLG